MAEFLIPDQGKDKEIAGFTTSTVLPSGLILASPGEVRPFLHNQSASLVQNGVQFQEVQIEGSKNALLVPQIRDILASKPQGGELTRVDQKGLLQYGFTGSEEVKIRPASEIALALQNPMLFLRKEVEKRYDAELPDTVVEVLNHLQNFKRNDTFSYSAETLQRISTQVGKEDSPREVSSPGAFEAVALVVLDTLTDPELKEEADMFVVLLPQLLHEYRRQALPAMERPEMPDLTIMVIEALQGTLKKNTRQLLYELLNEVTIPPSLHEDLLNSMDKNHDLHQPLAFQLTVSLAENSPESLWIKEQRLRREKILSVLDRSPQELFDHYADLVALSQGLVYSGDLINDELGKIGMEFEFTLEPEYNDKIFDIAGKYSKKIKIDNPYTKILDSKWDFHDIDIHYAFEASRSGEALIYDLPYENSLVTLSQWFSDYAINIGSMHIHLDKVRHLSRPTLGKIYEGMDGFKRLVDKNLIGTWEVRGLDLPNGIHSYHPGRVADAVRMLISAASEEKQSNDKLKISFPEDSSKITFEQLLWGHLTYFIENSEGRLNAFMALRDAGIFKFANPLAFALSYDQSLLNKIADISEGVCKLPSASEMCTVLKHLGLDDYNHVIRTISWSSYLLIKDILDIGSSVPIPEPGPAQRLDTEAVIIPEEWDELLGRNRVEPPLYNTIESAVSVLSIDQPSEYLPENPVIISIPDRSEIRENQESLIRYLRNLSDVYSHSNQNSEIIERNNHENLELYQHDPTVIIRQIQEYFPTQRRSQESLLYRDRINNRTV